MDFDERARQFYRSRSSSTSISTTTTSSGSNNFSFLPPNPPNGQANSVRSGIGNINLPSQFNQQATTSSILLQHLQTKNSSSSVTLPTSSASIAKSSSLLSLPKNSFNQALANKLTFAFTGGRANTNLNHHHRRTMSDLLGNQAGQAAAAAAAAAFYNNYRAATAAGAGGGVHDSTVNQSPLLAATLLREQQLFRNSLGNLSAGRPHWHGLPDEHHVSSTNVERRLRSTPPSVPVVKRQYNKRKVKLTAPSPSALMARATLAPMAHPPSLPPPPPPPPQAPIRSSPETASVAMAHQNDEHNSLAASMPLLSAYLRGERNCLLNYPKYTHLLKHTF